MRLPESARFKFCWTRLWRLRRLANFRQATRTFLLWRHGPRCMGSPNSPIADNSRLPPKLPCWSSRTSRPERSAMVWREPPRSMSVYDAHHIREVKVARRQRKSYDDQADHNLVPPEISSL